MATFNIIQNNFTSLSLVESHEVKTLAEARKLLKPWMGEDDVVEQDHTRVNSKGIYVTPLFIVNRLNGKEIDIFGQFIHDERAH